MGGILSLITKSPLLGLAFAFSLVIAITIHEFAHAYVAYRYGDDTPLDQGRVSLNPLAHLDLLGSISMLLFGFGWGKPVMINPRNFSKPIHELWVSLAGPASNLLLAFIVLVINYGIHLLGYNFINADLLYVLVIINLTLAAFNLLPIPPLDGSSIVAYFWPEYRSIVSGQIGLFILLILIFIPLPGGLNLLQLFMQPVINIFIRIVTLGGLLGAL